MEYYWVLAFNAGILHNFTFSSKPNKWKIKDCIFSSRVLKYDEMVNLILPISILYTEAANLIFGSLPFLNLSLLILSSMWAICSRRQSTTSIWGSNNSGANFSLIHASCRRWRTSRVLSSSCSWDGMSSVDPCSTYEFRVRMFHWMDYRYRSSNVINGNGSILVMKITSESIRFADSLLLAPTRLLSIVRESD